MNTLLTLCIVATLACSSLGAELKVGTVDIQRLIRNYYRAEQVAKDIDARQNAVAKELAGLRLEGERLAKEAQNLQGLSLDPALNAQAREEKKRSFQLKLSDLHAFEVRYDETRAQREAELQTQATQANKRILEEVFTVTRGVGEKEGFNLILNASKMNLLNSDVVFTRNVDDVTEKVLANLNAGKPASQGTNSISKPENTR